MKIAICDDRKSDRSALKALLEAYGQDYEIREYSSGKSLCGDMGYIRKCGIVFLDINMGGWRAGWTAWKKSGRGRKSSMTFSATSLWGLVRQRSCRWISTRSCSTGLWITQRSIRTAGWFSSSATEWKSAQRFKAGSGRGIEFVSDAFGRFFCMWK